MKSEGFRGMKTVWSEWQGTSRKRKARKASIKRHGAATDKTVYNTVKIAYGLAKNNLVEKISEEFEKK